MIHKYGLHNGTTQPTWSLRSVKQDWWDGPVVKCCFFLIQSSRLYPSFHAVFSGMLEEIDIPRQNFYLMATKMTLSHTRICQTKIQTQAVRSVLTNLLPRSPSNKIGRTVKILYTYVCKFNQTFLAYITKFNVEK